MKYTQGTFTLPASGNRTTQEEWDRIFSPAEPPALPSKEIPVSGEREKRLEEALREILARIHRIKPLSRMGNENIIAGIAEKALREVTHG